MYCMKCKYHKTPTGKVPRYRGACNKYAGISHHQRKIDMKCLIYLSAAKEESYHGWRWRQQRTLISAAASHRGAFCAENGNKVRVEHKFIWVLKKSPHAKWARARKSDEGSLFYRIPGSWLLQYAKRYKCSETLARLAAESCHLIKAQRQNPRSAAGMVKMNGKSCRGYGNIKRKERAKSSALHLYQTGLSKSVSADHRPLQFTHASYYSGATRKNHLRESLIVARKLERRQKAARPLQPRRLC